MSLESIDYFVKTYLYSTDIYYEIDDPDLHGNHIDGILNFNSQPIYLKYNNFVFLDRLDRNTTIHLENRGKQLVHEMELKFTDIKKAISPNSIFSDKKYEKHSLEEYLSFLNETYSNIKNRDAFVKNYFKNEYENFEYEIIPGEPEIKINDIADEFEKLINNRAPDIIYNCYKAQVNILKEMLEFLRSQIDKMEGNIVDVEDKSGFNLNMTEQLLIIFFMQDNQNFPKYSSISGKSEKSFKKFIAGLLNEKYDSVDNAYKTAREVYNQKEFTGKQKKPRTENLINVKKVFEFLGDQNILKLIDDKINLINQN